MKKLILAIILTLAISSVSAHTIIKLNYTKNIVGIDVGYVSEKSIYQCIGFSPMLNKYLPAYFNYGIGYVFYSHFYGMGLFGTAMPPITQQTLTHRNLDYFNVGVETGYICDKYVLSVFYTNTVGLGLKLGYTFNFD